MANNKTLTIAAGQQVIYRGQKHRISQVLSLAEVELLDEQTQQLCTADISELESVVAMADDFKPDLLVITDEAWAIAKSRYDIIKPLLDLPSRTRLQMEDAAAKHGIYVTTLYRWIKDYSDSGLLTGLLPKQRRDKGQVRFDEQVEEVIRQVIATEYLSKQKKSVHKVCSRVRELCLEKNLAVPHANTVRNRVKALSGELVAAARLGRKTADLSYKPHEGKFPGADYPLAVVQIDHTKLDIILVDDHYRQPIGRPWITLAFDVYSRMITGFYVSFDPPSALSTGLCLVHAILPKDKWLNNFDVKNQWPVWGLPVKVHLDNAKEFRGQMLTRAFEQYGIDIEWRPVGRPNFGAHVERVLGTFSKEIHELAGATFANVRQKGEYDSEGKAALTLSEFEAWLTTCIVDVYHQKVHSSIGMAPIAAWHKGIFGDDQNPGAGLPAKITDEYKLRLDLMPFELRTVQDYGVQIDEIHYYHDVLRRWINAPDLKEPSKKRKFTFRRDPRDISQIWFYDPELSTYYPIPYRDTSHPAISIWELREAKSRAEADGRRHVDERAIFDAYERMREIERQSIDKSKAVRRLHQRRKGHSKAHKPLNDVVSPKPAEQWPTDTAVPDIQPFDEMDDLL